MNGIIRKLKLSYPFKVGEHQKLEVFSIDDTAEKFAGNKIHSIIEGIDEITNRYVYKIMVSKNNKVQLWKEISPHDCTKEVEYLLND